MNDSNSPTTPRLSKAAICRRLLIGGAIVSGLCFVVGKRVWAFFSTLDEKRIVTHAVSDFENIADSDLLELQSALYELRHADGSEVSLGTYIQDRERIAGFGGPNDWIGHELYSHRQKLGNDFDTGELHHGGDLMHEVIGEIQRKYGTSLPVEMSGSPYTFRGGSASLWKELFAEYIDQMVKKSSQETHILLEFGDYIPGGTCSIKVQATHVDFDNLPQDPGSRTQLTRELLGIAISPSDQEEPIGFTLLNDGDNGSVYFYITFDVGIHGAKEYLLP